LAIPLKRRLTELEGAILTEIAMRGNDTAYKVRRAFQNSPSVHWRGSAGAVSPAVWRLTAAGLIETAPHGTRRGQVLRLSEAGEEALFAWASDCDQAIGLGLDPFRLRSGVWDGLPGARRTALMDKLQFALTIELNQLRRRNSADIIDRRQTQLAMALIEGRLKWLKGAKQQ
jgi:DNA-binding PadR family transcriptional regulator